MRTWYINMIKVLYKLIHRIVSHIMQHKLLMLYGSAHQMSETALVVNFYGSG